MTMRDKVKERYENDRVFHAVVDMLRATILKYELTPSEIREAAMLACVMEDERNPQRIVVALDPTDVERLHAAIEFMGPRGPYR